MGDELSVPTQLKCEHILFFPVLMQCFQERSEQFPVGADQSELLWSIPEALQKEGGEGCYMGLIGTYCSSPMEASTVVGDVDHLFFFFLNVNKLSEFMVLEWGISITREGVDAIVWLVWFNTFVCTVVLWRLFEIIIYLVSHRLGTIDLQNNITWIWLTLMCFIRSHWIAWPWKYYFQRCLFTSMQRSCDATLGKGSYANFVPFPVRFGPTEYSKHIQSTVSRIKVALPNHTANCVKIASQ